MQRIKALWLVSIFAVSYTSLSNAFEVDTNKYFAFHEVPGFSRNGVTSYTSYLFLSHEKCEATGVHVSFKAFKALRYATLTQLTRHECWVKLNDEIILVCPIGKTETGAIGNACSEIDKREFIDTASLPKSANF